VRALVAATFPGEAAPWYANEHLPRRFIVPGLAVKENPTGEVRCSTRGLCVTVVGTTKAKSGPGTTALLTYRGWDLSRARFLLVGIAGIATWNGTIGGVGIGDIVDTNLGTDYVQAGQAHAVTPPIPGWDPFDEDNPYDQAVYRLPLAGWAYQLTRHVKLTDDATARTERAYYGPQEAAEKPAVRHCGVRGHDSFWVGADQARRQDRIYTYRIRQYNAAHHTSLSTQGCTSAFEDPGWAGALSRFGLLGRAVSVRTGSDFEDQRPGTSPADLYDLLHTDQGFAGYTIAVENEWRVGTVIAHAWTR
jgi:purine nucleoside permease